MLPKKITLFGLVFFCISINTYAGELNIQISNSSDKPVVNAVAYLLPHDGRSLSYKAKQETIDQINKEFVPQVKVISKNALVQFPNKDNIRHHVYSFSDAKKFELPLYEGTPSKPILFDKTGEITLGCNIHDWMKAYVLVVDTPYYAQSNESGKLTINDIDAGKYLLYYWHPQQKSQAEAQLIEISDTPLQLKATIELKKTLKKRRSPRGRGRRY